MQSKILTPLQEETLNFFFDNGMGNHGFYFSGGTALTEYYFPYRYSDDLDFFINTNDLLEHIDWIEKLFIDKKYEITKKSKDHAELKFYTPSETLMFHFQTHPHPKMAPLKKAGNIIYDSLEDIAVNKVTCLTGRDEPKDAYDLYYILNNSQFSFDYLLNRAKEKIGDFDHDENVLNWAVSKLLDIPTKPVPKLIEKIDPLEVKEYFKNIAIAIINRYRPQNT